MNASRTFPKHLLEIGGKPQFFSFEEACRVYDSGFVTARFGRLVLNEDLTVREMTDEDRSRISDAALEYSASK